MQETALQRICEPSIRVNCRNLQSFCLDHFRMRYSLATVFRGFQEEDRQLSDKSFSSGPFSAVLSIWRRPIALVMEHSQTRFPTWIDLTKSR
jgi:hypothetical protein